MAEYWQGLTGIRAAVGKAKDTANKGARRGVMLALRNTLDESNKHVPHEEGDLERDGGISLDDSTNRGAVSYGRSADTKDYAVAQHENMENSHDPGRNAKFLEQAMASTRPDNLKIIAAEVKKELGT